MADKKAINFDSSDLEGMRKLMDLHGDSEFPFFGTNEDGEDVIISVCRDNIMIRTFQHNRWVRVATYWRDGVYEETFEGRWE